MKTKLNIIKISLLAGLVFSALLVRSNTEPSAKGVPVETAKTIRKYFKFPQVLIPQLHSSSEVKKVEVLFSTDQSGKVTYVAAKTEDQNLKREIEKQFMSLHLEGLKDSVGLHTVVLSFRVM